MNKDEFSKSYFTWMYNLAFGNHPNYKMLFNTLNNIEFTYIHPYDENRLEDGVSLRYDFCYRNNLPYDVADSYFDNKHCSVLEMMLALAIRCEDHFVSNPIFTVERLFFDMLKSLGIHTMTDRVYDRTKVISSINTFLNREYEPNGKGGLFTIDTDKDLRKEEIWYQMCWYTNTIN